MMQRLNDSKWIFIALSLLQSACSSMPGAEQPVADQRYSFALIGDTPYGAPPASDFPPFERLVTAINKQSDLLWVVHTGDMKSSAEDCSNELFRDRLERFSRFKQPFIYTPGDNEWTDCHKVNAGEYEPLERLHRLRELFFAEPGSTVGRQVESQSFTPGYETFVENLRWSQGGVIFTTLHVVGSQNGLAPFDPQSFIQRSEADRIEVKQRIAAALAWIEATFEQANRDKAPAVFLVMHANPALEADHNLPSAEALKASRDGFQEILESLERHTQAYAKPVVLAHGDSHYFRIDKPRLAGNRSLPNFTRVENFGAGAAALHWVKVTVDPTAFNPFLFQPMGVEEGL